MTLVQQQFFPTASRLELIVDLKMREGASFTATAAQVRRLEQILKADPQIAHFTAYTGAGAPRFFLSISADLPNPGLSQVVVNTRSIADREAVRGRLLELFAKGEQFPDLRGRVTRFEFGPPVGFPVQFRVIGPDTSQVRDIAYRVRDTVRSSPLVRDTQLDWDEQVRTLRVALDQDKARWLGITSADVAAMTQTVLSGVPVTQIRRGEDLIDVTLRALPEERLALERLGDVNLFTRTGAVVPLSQVATLTPTFEEPVLWRRNRDMALTVRADVIDGVQGPAATSRIWPSLQPIVDSLPSGYRIEIGGAFEETQKSNTALFAVFPLMFVVMLFFLMLQLQSFSRMWMVFLTAPLALIGVVPALLIFNAPFGFVALLGVIALSGMIMRNAVILVDQIDTDIAAGVPALTAVVEATVRRSRPVVLTAAAAVLAMVPLAGSVFWGPMAIAIMGGLIVGDRVDPGLCSGAVCRVVPPRGRLRPMRRCAPGRPSPGGRHEPRQPASLSLDPSAPDRAKCTHTELPGSRPAAHHVEQAAHDALAIGAQAVVRVLVGDPRHAARAPEARCPRPRTAPRTCRRRTPSQPPAPRCAPAGRRRTGAARRCSASSCAASRWPCSPAVVVPHPGEDMLPAEQFTGHRVFGGQAVRRPACGAAIGIAGLVQRRVDRVALPGRGLLRIPQEGRRREGQLEQVMQPLEPGAVAQPHPGLAEAARREAVAVGQANVLVVEPAQEAAQTIEVARVARVVALVGFARARPGGRVDLVDRPARHRRQAAGDQHLPQGLGGQRQVGERGEAAEALAEQAPALDAEFGADQFQVAHDRVRAKVREVLGLIGRRGTGNDRPDRRGAPGAALVQQQHTKVGQRPRHPARGRARGARGLEAGATLQEDEVGAVAAVGRCHLAGEHADPAALRVAVNQGNDVLALGQHGAGDGVGGAHGDTIPGVAMLAQNPARGAWPLTGLERSDQPTLVNAARMRV